MGLFRRKSAAVVATKPKAFRIELGWRGMFGLILVCFCLFLWMFLLGIWAGQTILLPPRAHQSTQITEGTKAAPSETKGISGATQESGTPVRQVSK